MSTKISICFDFDLYHLTKLSDLSIAMAKGFFYLESKYGGYISQVKIQIANSSAISGRKESFTFTFFFS